MKFTVVFESHEATCLAFDLVFIPSPAWVTARIGDPETVGADADSEFINLNPATPYYQLGSVAQLIEKVPAVGAARSAIVIVHPVGHGGDVDYKSLLADLARQEVAVQVVKMQHDDFDRSAR